MKKEINSVSLDFEIPMFKCSGMNMYRQFLQNFERGRGTSLYLSDGILCHAYTLFTVTILGMSESKTFAYKKPARS